MPRMRSKCNRTQHRQHKQSETRRPYLIASPALWLTVSDVRKPTLSTGDGSLPTGLSTVRMDWVSYTGNHHHNYKQHFKLCGCHLYDGKLRRVMAADSGGAWFELWPGEGLLAYYAWPRTSSPRSREKKRNPWRQHVHRATRPRSYAIDKVWEAVTSRCLGNGRSDARRKQYGGVKSIICYLCFMQHAWSCYFYWLPSVSR